MKDEMCTYFGRPFKPHRDLDAVNVQRLLNVIEKAAKDAEKCLKHHHGSGRTSSVDLDGVPDA